MYQNIRRSAYHLAEGSEPWTEDFRALAFPEHWHAELLELHNYGRDEEKRQLTLPTRRLDGVLQTLAPDVIVRPRPRIPVEPGPEQSRRIAEDYWMYVPASATDPLPDRSLRQLLDAWLRTLGPKGAGQEPGFRSLLLASSAGLKRNLPEWQPVTGVELLTAPVTDGGTAAPDPWQFQLATDALARRILTLDPYPFEGGELRFRAVPRGPRDQGAELMSQPLCRTVKRKEWWFSVVLNISLHTTPFDARPRLHLHWGVRRWATHPRAATKRLNLSYREATTVYLRPTIPWLPGAPATERYALARLRRDRAADTFAWAENDTAGILRGLSLAGNFPDPEQLLAEPGSWIGEGRGVRAAVVHSTRMGKHEIGTGFMPNQRAQLTEWAEQALPETVVRVPDLRRGRGKGIGAPDNRRPKPRTDEAKKAELLRETQARRANLAAQARIAGGHPHRSGPPLVEVRLLWQSPEVRKEAVTQFAHALGLDGDGGASAVAIADRDFDEARPGAPVVLEWRTEELTLRLRCLPLADGLGDRLVPDPAVGAKGAAIATAIGERRRALRSWLSADGADPDRPELALVEIAHRSTFRPSTTDPKFAVRLGCADAGVLTQFVVTPSTDRQIDNADSIEHRTHSSWLDGLRQLGVRVLPQHTLGDDLPDGLQYAAIWMVKRRKDGPTRLPKHLPVAVLTTPLPDAVGLAAVRGWDDTAGEWVPYPRFLLGLVKQAEIDPDACAEPDAQDVDPYPASSRVTGKQWRTNLAQQRKETSAFLQRVLHSLRGEPTALITHAQNSRLHWPWLQDGRIERDLIQTGHAPAGRLDDELRLVRVRGCGGRETAQWWGLAEPGKPHGQPAGFWAQTTLPPGGAPSRDRIFYSTTERPGTHAVSPALDRLATRVNAAGNLTSQAGTSAWNPTLVEISVLGCHADGDPAVPALGKPDEAEALALAVHQLRQAPDYAAALSLPLPLHLAALAQAYVLPMLAESDVTPGGETAELSDERWRSATGDDLDPDLMDAAGLTTEPETETEEDDG
ncbi:pPIWI_RE module domain-containing protein [Streptomyces sp. NPDC056039]|uniref:pPIWI_RE module domain-containing protein n=1 Tax=Streptomyces sp. NPDC056039 TaxID=3345687 RepID=UPI0035E1943F